MTDRLCKDCKHFRSKAFIEDAVCDVADPTLLFWVDGVNRSRCFDERSEQGPCGPEGLRWEARS